MKRGSFNLILLLALSISLISCSTLGLGGETHQTTIGITNTKFYDEERDRTLKTYIWYPAEEQMGKEWGGNKVFAGMFASKNAEPIFDQKQPLYILVHGTYGSWRNMPWLVDDLVQEGAIVAAADHPGSTWGDISPKSVLQTWDQPQDVSFLIDSMLASEYGPYIDQENIVVVGFSLGGYSAMAIAGGTLQLDLLPIYCETSAEEICEYLAPEFDHLDEDFYALANHSYRDKRVKAAVALAPGFGAMFDQKSLGSLETPLLIIGAENDINAPPVPHLHPLVNALPEHSRYYELTEATHFTFFRICKDGAEEILAKDGEEFVCDDSGAKSRQTLHSEVVDQIKLFLHDS